MYKNCYGILEPKQQQAIPIEDLDILFVPLVAFDDELNRLGMGGGYYDRALSRSPRPRRPLLIGLAHQGQKVAQLNTQYWDIPLDMVLTDQKRYTKKPHKDH